MEKPMRPPICCLKTNMSARESIELKPLRKTCARAAAVGVISARRVVR